jgi:hypothetical protein
MCTIDERIEWTISWRCSFKVRFPLPHSSVPNHMLADKGKKSTTHEKALRNRRNEIVKNARDKADALKQETEAKLSVVLLHILPR